jgi:hypothetical protein
MVKDIQAGEGNGVPSRHRTVFTDATGVGEILYFVADDGAHGRELWRSDGPVQYEDGDEPQPQGEFDTEMADQLTRPAVLLSLYAGPRAGTMEE